MFDFFLRASRARDKGGGGGAWIRGGGRLECHRTINIRNPFFLLGRIVENGVRSAEYLLCRYFLTLPGCNFVRLSACSSKIACCWNPNPSLSLLGREYSFPIDCMGQRSCTDDMPATEMVVSCRGYCFIRVFHRIGPYGVWGNPRPCFKLYFNPPVYRD